MGEITCKENKDQGTGVRDQKNNDLVWGWRLRRNGQGLDIKLGRTPLGRGKAAQPGRASLRDSCAR